jgi:glucose/arabinose dehydrogenase
MSGGIKATAQETGPLLKANAAFGAWQQDRPGVKQLLAPQDLPPIGWSAPNFAEVVAMPAGAKPSVPTGFSVEMVASGLAGPRAIRVAPNGDLFVADSTSNTVRVLRIPAGNTRPTKSLPRGSTSPMASPSTHSGRTPSGSTLPIATASSATVTGTAI